MSTQNTTHANQKEHIKASAYGDFLCICGNTPSDDGFYPINEKNEEVEPTSEDWKTNQYFCNQCGRVIDQNTLEVVRQLNPKDIKKLS
jgi:hypothetical protein